MGTQPENTHGIQTQTQPNPYSHLSNKRGGWNKRGGGAKFAKSLNVEGGILWKKLMHNLLNEE